MQNDLLASLARLSDAELVGRVKTLVARERDVTAEIVAHLAELDTREVHLREGYPSLYIYCRDALGLSEWEAYNRMEVARAARRFPLILELLAEGSVNLTTVKLLAPLLTPENHRDVLQAARGKRKAGIEAMVARLAPKPDAPCSVRRLPSQPASHRPETRDDGGESAPVASLDAALSMDVVPALESIPPTTAVDALSIRPVAAVTALSPDRYKFQVTISGETLEKIRLAKDMLGHAIPSGDDAAILDRAYTALLADLAKKKFAHISKGSRASRIKPGSGTPSGTIEKVAKTTSAPIGKASPRTPCAAVKRAVWLRDLGRCAFVAAGGHRCNERRFVEFHHLDPYALGGEATVEGIQLRCRRHNDYEGRLYFGKRRPVRELVPEQVRLSPSRSTS